MTELLAPPPELRFRRRVSLVEALREVWRSRELVRALVERQMRSRYKQAILGIAWALIPPVVLMVIFSVVFERVGNIDTKGIPYPLFAYLGLLPWTFFTASVTGATSGASSLLGNKDLLNKIYCPREIFPISSLFTSAIDTAVALVVLAGLFIFFGFVPRATSAWVPILLLVQVVFTLGITMLFSALVVSFRDLRHALPLVLQFGLFATPVAYGADIIPSYLHWLYALVNPLAPVIDGYRNVMLYGRAPSWSFLLPGAISAFAILIFGFRVFKRMEASFADVA
jgi:ABC-type polysaccharide/polyol phosphate export permease